MNVVTAALIAIAALLLIDFLPELAGRAFPPASAFTEALTAVILTLSGVGVFAALFRRGA